MRSGLPLDSSRRTLVNICLDNTHCLEQLSWAVTVASRPGDSVTALLLLPDSDSEIRSIEKQYERARAGISSLLEQCRELCHFRQVAADVRIVPVFNADVKLTVLVEQAALLAATTLVLSSSDVSPHSKLQGFTVCEKPAPQSCLVFVADVEPDTGMTKPAAVVEPRLPHEHERGEHHDELVQRLLPEKPPECHFTDQVQPALEFIKEVPSDYSPRGVLEGPRCSNAAVSSSPETTTSTGSTSLSPHFTAPKPLLLAPAAPNDLQTEEDEEDEELSASCLSLFKNMKRQHTFPMMNHRRKLIPSFSCSSTQSGMRFSTELNHWQSIFAGPWRCFTYDELLRSTNAFHADNFIGQGGYAVVYKGRLPDGELIAVKKLIVKENSEQHKEGGFLSELGIIGHVSHRNTTSLIGFCVEQGLHLIFPYSPNGSLSSVLHGPKAKVLEWPLRYKIALGAARGLHYLHKVCPRRIIHRDIKASNILLGPDFEPQICDFGLAKWLPEQWTHHTLTPVEGTFGYLAPEYVMHGIVDEKTDVFAYGVLLLELITGRKPIDSTQRHIVTWAKPYLESCNVQELVDPQLNGAYDVSQARRLILTAALCVRQSALWRPCMNQVLKLLTEEDGSSTWSSLLRSSTNTEEEEYKCDLSKHRALALESCL